MILQEQELDFLGKSQSLMIQKYMGRMSVFFIHSLNVELLAQNGWRISYS